MAARLDPTCSTVRERGKEYIFVPSEFHGCAIRWPRHLLKRGTYSVDLDIMALPCLGQDGDCCIIDVYDEDKSVVVFEKRVAIKDVGAIDRKTRITFNLLYEAMIEIRLHGLSSGRLLVDANIALSEVENKECNDNIFSAYRLVLGRHPDVTGLQLYNKLINEDGWSIDQVRDELMRSSEFEMTYNMMKAREARLAGRIDKAVNLIETALRSGSVVPESVRAEAFAIRLANASEIRKYAAVRHSVREDELPVYIPFLGIGTTGLCNASCEHCPTGKISTANSPRHPMPMPLFEKIIMDTREAGLCITGVIALGLFGDSLVDPFIVDRVNCINDMLPEARIIVSTNAAAYDRIKHSSMVTKIEYIKVHVESLNPGVYNKLMTPLRAERVLPKVDMIVEDFRRKAIICMPVHSENVGEIGSLREHYLSKGAERVDLQKLFRRSSIDAGIFDRLAIKPERHRCGGKVLDDLIIDCDGATLICCNDFTRSERLGDLNSESVIDVLMNSRRQAMRERLNRGEHDEISTCATCHIDQFVDTL